MLGGLFDVEKALQLMDVKRFPTNVSQPWWSITHAVQLTPWTFVVYFSLGRVLRVNVLNQSKTHVVSFTEHALQDSITGMMRLSSTSCLLWNVLQGGNLRIMSFTDFAYRQIIVMDKSMKHELEFDTIHPIPNMYTDDLEVGGSHVTCSEGAMHALLLAYSSKTQEVFVLSKNPRVNIFEMPSLTKCATSISIVSNTYAPKTPFFEDGVPAVTFCIASPPSTQPRSVVAITKEEHHPLMPWLSKKTFVVRDVSRTITFTMF